MEHDTDVLVVGAGPVGLFLACDLRRRGVAVRLVDRNDGPTELSKAVGIHARTLEAFQDLGIADTAIERGLVVPDVAVHARRRLVGRVRLDRLDSPFAMLLDLEQGQTERLLIEHLGRLGSMPERRTSLIAFEQDDTGVTATLEVGDGRRSTCRARYLVGCDGAHSSVRHMLGLGFEGDAYPANMLLADVRLDWALPGNEAVIALWPDGLLFVAPLPGGRMRVIGNVADDVREVDLARVQALLDERSPVAVRATEPAWLTTFRISERQVTRYQDRRVFLAGDAAHVHSPAGGQGMNTGIQDAYNLGWKLGLAVGDRAAPGLLDSYDAERRPVGAMVLAQTGRLLRTASLTSPVARFLRDTAMGVALQRPRVQKRLTRQLSQLAVAYTDSPVVITSWRHAHHGVAAGARAPDGPLVDGATQQPSTLFELLRGTGHAFLGFGAGEDAGLLLEAAALLRETGPEPVPVLLVTPGDTLTAGFTHRDPGGRLHGRYGASAPCLYILRPDGYVGLACRPPDPAAVGRYLARIAARGD